MSKKINSLPSFDYLNSRFEYKRGALFYKRVSADFFGSNLKAQTKAFLFNADVAGSLVPTSSGATYKTINIDGKRYFLHRVIWKIVHGKDPEFIDHIDGDVRNNKVENLRSVKSSGNCKNKARLATNKSGQLGVSRSPSGRWKSYIGNNGVTVNLGTFDTFEDAVSARKLAERKYGYHENHGRDIVEFKGDYKRDVDSPYVQKKASRTARLNRGYFI